MKTNCALAGLALTIAATAGTAAQAAPPVNLSPAVGSTGSAQVDKIRCNCGHRIHRRHRVVRVVPDAYVPVYPAPPVGFTLRKLFDAGYF